MTLKRRRDVDVIGGITLKYIVLGDQTSGTFSQKDLVAKFDRFLYFPPLDQIGVSFKDRVDLVVVWNLLSLKYAAAALIDDTVAELAVVVNLPSKLTEDNIVQQINSAFIFGLFEYPSGIFNNLLGNPNKLAIFVLLLGGALFRCQSLDLLHPTARRASTIGKAIDPLGNKLCETTHEPRDHSHPIPEQRIVGWMMDIGFDHRRIDAQFLAILQPQSDGRFKDQVIEGLKSLRPKFIKGPIERVMFGNAAAVKTCEPAQRVSVGDSLSEFPIVPVLDPHKNERAKDLRRGDGRATRVWLLQTPLKIVADELNHLRLIVEEFGNSFENGVEVNALGEKLHVGEVDLGVCDSCHFLTL